MSESRVRMRVRQGTVEAEIEASKDDILEMIDLIPTIVSKLSTSSPPQPVAVISPSQPQELPEVKFERGESLPSLIIKLFNSQWGRQPRKLLEVKDLLANFGFVYPKQSVAVALLRLAKEGKLRRFKQPDGEYVYTASTSLLAPELVGETLEIQKGETA